MSFGKHTLSNVVATLLGAASLFVLGGCGGETGGGVTGIVGALTNAKVRVSSFNLSTTAPINNLVEVGTNVRATDITGIDGALYPTRNSNSFRVLLKGAGSNREDVTYYFDTYNPDLASQYVPNPTPTEDEPWDFVLPAHDGLPRTELRKIYFAKRVDDPSTPEDENTGKEVIAVFKRPGTSPAQYEYEDNGAIVPLATTTVYEAQGGAFSYSQITASRPVRTGRRNVIVQFFSGNAPAVKTAFEQTIPGATVPSDEETNFLSNNLTNSYVFTTFIPPKAKEISLTSSFQANNGDNGLVDSGDLTLVANNLPARWGSVKFEAYEENYGFGKPSIVFSKIVNLTDVKGYVGSLTEFTDVVALDKAAPSYVSVSGFYDPNTPDYDPGNSAMIPNFPKGGFPFANRQRVLRVYATCYELPDAGGAVLAQTLENGTTYNDDDGRYPVQFISTPRAEADLFFPAPGTAKEAEAQLKNMVLTKAISDVKASVPPISKGDLNGQTITVTGTSTSFVRFAYNATPAPTSFSKDLIRTLSNTGFVFKIDPDSSHALNGYTVLNDLNPPVLALAEPGAPNSDQPGRLTWPTANTVEFSQVKYPQAAERIRYRSYYPPTAGEQPGYFAAPLVPTQGTGGGVIRGGSR